MCTEVYANDPFLDSTAVKDSDWIKLRGSGRGEQVSLTQFIVARRPA